jgi:hypothetical protein
MTIAELEGRHLQQPALAPVMDGASAGRHIMSMLSKGGSSVGAKLAPPPGLPPPGLGQARPGQPTGAAAAAAAVAVAVSGLQLPASAAGTLGAAPTSAPPQARAPAPSSQGGSKAQLRDDDAGDDIFGELNKLINERPVDDEPLGSGQSSMSGAKPGGQSAWHPCCYCCCCCRCSSASLAVRSCRTLGFETHLWQAA